VDDRPTCIFVSGSGPPGILAYAPLIGALGDEADARVRELEVFAFSPPPEDFAIDDEIQGLLASAQRTQLDRFHLYGSSAGGSVALAFTAARPEMVLSLTLSEAACDYSEEMLADLTEYRRLAEQMADDPVQTMARLRRLKLKPGVEFEPAPDTLPNRPAGYAALLRAYVHHRLDVDALRSFQGPVLYMRGALSEDIYERSASRLAMIFPNFREVVFDGLHHLKAPHKVEPTRVASLLIELWAAAPQAAFPSTR
jgi:pimeloyl-ACP methyl ester carboxylesterase